jgi:uncharacterized membrane protein YkvA (DUF1232 family)
MAGKKGTSYEQYKKEIADESAYNAKKQYVAQGLSCMNKGPIAAIWDKVQALWKYILSNEVSWYQKVAPLAALVYLVSPIDLVPDFIPVAGLLDDVGVLTAAFASMGSVLNKYLKT